MSRSTLAFVATIVVTSTLTLPAHAACTYYPPNNTVIGGAATVASGDTWCLSSNFQLTIAPLGTLTIDPAGTLIIESGDTFLFNDGKLINDGLIVMSGGGINPPGTNDGGVIANRFKFENNGAIVLEGGFGGAGGPVIGNDATGTIKTSPCSTITLNDGTGPGASGPGEISNFGEFDNKGTITLNGRNTFCGNGGGGGTLVNAGASGIFKNKAQGRIENLGGAIDNSGVFSNRGMIKIGFTGNPIPYNHGVFINSGNGVFLNGNNGEFYNWGAVVGYGGTLTNAPGGTFTTVSPSGRVLNIGGAATFINITLVTPC